MTTVYFVRHAHSSWVPDREAERPLSERSRRNAARVADLLADRDVDAVVSSPYARAAETVRPVADRHGLEVTVEDDFHERRLTDGPVETIGETFESAIAGVWEDWAFAWPGGESNFAAQEHGVAAVERTLERYEGESVVVGTPRQPPDARSEQLRRPLRLLGGGTDDAGRLRSAVRGRGTRGDSASVLQIGEQRRSGRLRRLLTRTAPTNGQ
ncbi:histidine phosphatase family protein [Haladaptatus halobius]|uniref:histidine phosphatase family protein n=1 Tax=Haladaptatus halobius TaxID=2884875 RepID=UPI001D0A1B68|nr:histidine phosphatase family protein [Haladaptatus halobius]